MEDKPTPPPVAPVEATPISCIGCGYNLTGAVIGSRCPECGLVIGRGSIAGSGGQTSGKAVAALVLGIVSIVGCMFYGLLSIPAGIVAIVLARGVKKDVAANAVSSSSLGLAQAGFVCGIIGLSLGLLMLAFFAAMIAFELGM